MLDARHVHRQVNRTVYDFSPEQLHNLTSIVWLYRGERERFLQLLDQHLGRAITAAQSCFKPGTDEEPAIPALLTALASFHETVEPACASLPKSSPESNLADRAVQALASLGDHAAAFEKLAKDAGRRAAKRASKPSIATLRDTLENITAKVADSAHSLAHETTEAVKLATRLADSLAPNGGEGGRRPGEGALDLRALRRLAKDLDAPRHAAVTALEQVRYSHRHAEWLLHRFPDAEFRDVPGLCKAATRAEIEAADWSLTPGRYVGVAPVEEDEGFDFEETMRGIHEQVADLNKDAVKLAKTIQQNFQELIG
jgi:type I restriction enzyme M protein